MLIPPAVGIADYRDGRHVAPRPITSVFSLPRISLLASPLMLDTHIAARSYIFNCVFIVQHFVNVFWKVLYK